MTVCAVTVRLAGISALTFTLAACAAAAQAPAPQNAQAAPPTAPELQLESDEPAPVTIGGETVLLVPTGAGPYTPKARAGRIEARIDEIVGDRSVPDPTITVVEAEGSFELHAGSRLVMVVTPADARAIGASRASVAQSFARDIESAIRRERANRAPGALVRAGGWGLLATVALCAVLWLIWRLTAWLRYRAEHWRIAQVRGLKVQNAELVSAERIAHGFDSAARITRWLLYLIAIDVYLTYVLGLFPWTRAASRQLLWYVINPAQMAAQAFVGYLPKLLFVVVISLIVRGIIKLVAIFFRQIEDGRIIFHNFPAEWAAPTYRIVRVLLIAFGLVVVFPYLPASDSAAFAGVSVFMGVLLSLSSSSAISNAIAGIVLTYTGAFRLGDRVKIADSVGDIIEMSMLATRVRTIKNEDITIPNSLVLGTAMTNYSRQASALGLILHTSVTIGYDTPWRTVHGLLIEAAAATPEISATPAPFVWQTALNDFYVTYEINAYTSNARDMMATYAALHANIQNKFFAAGVEIMSPHYTSLRDGNTVTVPEEQRPAGYQPSAFRVERTDGSR